MASDSPAHRPVLLTEVLEALRPAPGGMYVDCTAGAGGHSEAVLDASAPDGTVLGIDADPSALDLAAACLRRFGERVRLEQANYRELDVVLARSHTSPVNGILLDLGVSSMQLDQPARGFSFQADGPLDMRMDRSTGRTAADVVNTLPERELANLIFEFGEERFSRRIAREIVQRRVRAPFETTSDLARAIAAAVPGRPGWGIHPATRTFQALRIFVNDELGGLEEVLPKAVAALKPGGRLAVISFHSLEDRIVKRFFLANRERLEILTKKPLVATEAEQRQNPRSRSAKLRVAARLSDGAAVPTVKQLRTVGAS